MRVFLGKDAPFYDGKKVGPWAQVRRELIIVGRILFVLAFVFVMISFIPSVLGVRMISAKVSKAKADLSVLSSAIKDFKLDCGRYPTDAEGFHVLKVRPPGLKEWRGPYLQQELSLDPWANPYMYRQTNPNHLPGSRVDLKVKDGFQVESFGANGKPGGEGEDADLFDGSD